MRAITISLLYLGLLGGPSALGQGYRCDWAAVGIAGGGMSGADHRVGATAGQTAAGPMAGATYRAFIGFWQADYGVGIYERESPVLPEGLVTRLEAAFPNPAPGRASIRYALGAAGPVSLAVHDITGRRVRTLAAGPRPTGRHAVDWRGDDDAGRALANGVYLCRFAAGETRTTRKLILAR
ncbi:MAG: FlgD immunoglobulin-like domain containing protein [bacterium]